MKTKYCKSVYFAALAVLVCACSKGGGSVSPSRNEGELLFNCCTVEMTQTKSRYSVSEDFLSNVTVALYDEEKDIVCASFFPDVNNVKIKTVVGRKYSVYALFNCGDITSEFPTVEADVPNIVIPWVDSLVNAEGFPFVWTGSIDFTSDGQVVKVDAERLISKITFRIDQRNMLFKEHGSRFTLRSLALKNTPDRCLPFSADGSAGTKDYVIDSSTVSDVNAVNNGFPACFYSLENRRGTLLPDNRDPWNKIPSFLPGGLKDSCTYIEARGVYSTDSCCSREVIYRFYIGSDATTNFDLNRNEIYDITLMPSDSNVYRGTWKIEVGAPGGDQRGVFFYLDGKLTTGFRMYAKSSTIITTKAEPSNLQYSLFGDEVFVEAGLRCEPTGNQGEYRITSDEDVPIEMECLLYPRLWDGNIKQGLPITVVPAI